MASNRTALRMERCVAVVRCESERAYNRGYEVFLPMGSNISMEWRRLWTRRRSLVNGLLYSFVLCVGARPHCTAARGHRSKPQRTALTGLLITILCLSLCLRLRADKLSFDERMEIERGLTAEFATSKIQLPRSKKALVFHS